uniref:CCHC-type domain-containing protein n=1 Tax=Rhodnius prolixus TaxID=13249 RepID=T1HY18_RHOPR
MPDLNKEIPQFEGTEVTSGAKDWLRTINGVGKIHGWTEGLDLPFAEVKKLMLEGLWSRDVANHLLMKEHKNEDELLESLVALEKLTKVREERVRKERSVRDSVGTSRRNKDGPPFKVDSVTDKAEAKPQTIRCYRCGGTGHFSNNCTKTESKCYNCGEVGHISRDCPSPKREKICHKCKKIGHLKADCPEKALLTRMPQNDFVERYKKEAVIDDCYQVDSFIDTGSSVCIMRASTALRCRVHITSCEAPVYGFGEGSVSYALGKAVVKLSIDDVHVQGTELFIVADGCQPYELIVGRNWTEAPEVEMVKLGNKVSFGKSGRFPFLEIELQEKIRSQVVATKPVEVPAKSCMFIEARVDNLHLQIPITNHSENEKQIVEGQVIARNAEVGVNKISEDIVNQGSR